MSINIVKSWRPISKYTSMPTDFLGDWKGGKCRGNIQLFRYSYLIRYGGKVIKTIKIKDCENYSHAFILAQAYLYGFNKENGLLFNQYRECEDNYGKYLEVTAGMVTFTCDIDNLSNVEDHLWIYSNVRGYIYAKIKTQNSFRPLLFHRYVMGAKDSRVRIKHRDNDKTNNRKDNLLIEAEVVVN